MKKWAAQKNPRYVSGGARLKVLAYAEHYHKRKRRQATVRQENAVDHIVDIYITQDRARCGGKDANDAKHKANQ